jgi:hypothetical protein
MKYTLITVAQYRALSILCENGPLSASEFGLIFWAGHKAHNKVSNGGNGAQRGKAGWLMAGSYLGKLKKRGLVEERTFRQFTVTDYSKKAVLWHKKSIYREWLRQAEKECEEIGHGGAIFQGHLKQGFFKPFFLNGFSPEMVAIETLPF